MLSLWHSQTGFSPTQAVQRISSACESEPAESESASGTTVSHLLPAVSMQSVDVQVCIAAFVTVQTASRMQTTGVFMNTLNFSSKQTPLVLQPS